MKKKLKLKEVLIYSISLIVIIVASIVFIALKTSKGLKAIKLVKINYSFIIPALLFLFFFHLFDAIRLKEISKAFNITYRLDYGLATSFANTFGATITPFHIGGELITFYMLGRKRVKFHKISVIVTVKAITGTTSFIVLLPFAMYFLGLPHISKLGVLTTAIILILAIMVFYAAFKVANKSEKIRRELKRYLIMLAIFKKRGIKNFILSIVYSLLIYVSFLSITPFIVWALNGEGSFFHLFKKQLFLFYGIFLSPTPGGSGVGEIGSVIVYSENLPETSLIVFALLWRFISQYLSAAIGGLILIYLNIADIIKQSRQEALHQP